MYSERLKGVMRVVYSAAREDPRLLDMREPAAIQAAVVAHAIESMNSLDTPDFRERALALMRKFHEPPENGGGYQVLPVLEELLERGAEEWRARVLLEGSNERMAKQQQEMWKIRLSQKTAVAAEDFQVFVAQFLTIVLEECTGDAAPLGTRIIDRVRALVRPSQRSDEPRTIEAAVVPA